MSSYDIAREFVETHLVGKVPGDIRWLTAALEDSGCTTFEQFESKPDALWNVAIGVLGTATFTTAEAADPKEPVIERVIRHLLNVHEPTALEQQLQQANLQLATIQARRERIDQNVQQFNAQAAAQRDALDKDEQRWQQVKDTLAGMDAAVQRR